MFPLPKLEHGSLEYELDYNGPNEIKKTLVTASKRYSITGELLNMSNGIRKTQCMVILYNPILRVYPSSSTSYREMYRYR